MSDLAGLAQRFIADHPTMIAQLVALSGGITLVVVAARRRWKDLRFRASVTQDACYLVARALVTMPLAIALLAALDQWIGGNVAGLGTQWLSSLPLWLQFLGYVVVMDAVAYGTHRLFHAVPWLWRLHAVHHSQESLNAFTTVRVHLVEILIKRGLAWVPLAIIGSPDDALVAFVIFVALDGFWGFLVHSGARVSLGPLRFLLVDPAYHRVHHSRLPEHQHANYAERLVIWDVLLGSARFLGVDEAANLETGVDDPGFPHEQGASPLSSIRIYLAQLAYPFRARPTHTDIRSRPSD